MTRIYVLSGPESSGKTTLATALAGYWSAPLVPELARSYLQKKLKEFPEFQYQQDDLLAIARQQLDSEKLALKENPRRLICDTDLLVLIIWSEVKYGSCDTWILEQFQQSLQESKRHYILCDWQIPWETDLLREHADDRKLLFQRYKNKLKEYGIIYTAVGGSTMQRFRQINALAGSASV